MAADDISRGSMNPLWLIGLLAVGGGAALFGLQRTSDPTPSPNAPGQTAPKDESTAESSNTENIPDPLSVLRRYLRVAPPAQPKANKFHLELTREFGDSKYSLTLDQTLVPLAGDPPLSADLLKNPAQYEFLIATVPDPIETKFPHEFDSVVAAIQRAFEARNFVLRASRMPWPYRRQGNSKSTKKAYHRETPGVLLLELVRQKADTPRTYAIVCLVGESPISGIHKPALARALAARDTLNEALIPEKGIQWRHHAIRIVAPYFSGSQSSLIETLQAWKVNHPTGPPLKLFNGSATALVPQRFDEAQLVMPQSTVIPSNLLTRGVLRYLADSRKLELDPGDGRQVSERVAILVEANTVYGDSATRKFDDGKPQPKAGEQKPKPEQKQQLVPITSQIMFLPFPMSISQLEVDQQRSEQPGVVLPHTDFVEPRLPVREETRYDALPPYDPQAAASLAGQSLRTILTTIDQERIRYVGIFATDARDVVFLNQLIRKQCPDVRVFTTEPSVALLNPADSPYMRGMVVASTYPLTPIAQVWARTVDQRSLLIPFPTQSSQGYYNAVVVQFGRPDLLLGYRPPQLPGVRTFDRPPIWISVIGQSGRMVPVHCYTEYDEPSDEAQLYRCPPPEFNPANEQPVESALLPKRPIIGIPVGVLLGSLGAFLAMVWLGIAVYRPCGWQKLAVGVTPAEADIHRVRATRWVWRGVMLAGILLFVLPYTVPAWEWGESCCELPSDSWRHWFVFATAWAIIIILLAVVLVLGLRGIGRDVIRKGKIHWGYLGLAILILVTLSITMFWWRPQRADQRFFVYVRATDLSAGMSPVMPMGFLGAAAFALGWCSLLQADMARRAGLKCPYQFPWNRVATANKELQVSFRRQFRFLFESRSFIVLLGLVIPFLVCFVWHAFIIPLRSEEAFWWDWMMRAVFWGIAGAVVLTLARFLALWTRLAQLLEEIFRVPMVGAFERLPQEIARLFGGYLYSHRPRHRQLAAAAWALPIEARQELARRITAECPSLAWVFGEPGSKPPAENPPRPDEDDSRDRDRKWLTEQLWEYAQRFLVQLPGEWKNNPTDEAFGASETKEPTGENASAKEKKLLTNEKEEYIAAYVVLYLGAYFAQLRMLAYAIASAAPLLLFAAASYPFQPDRPRLLALVGLLAVVAIGIVYVLYRINKNALVSRIMRTTPNRFTPDAGFFSSIATYVLPLVALVILQLLGLFRFIVEPVLGILG